MLLNFAAFPQMLRAKTASKPLQPSNLPTVIGALPSVLQQLRMNGAKQRSTITFMVRHPNGLHRASKRALVEMPVFSLPVSMHALAATA